MSTTKAPENEDDRLSPSMRSLLQRLLEQELKQPKPMTEALPANALIGRLVDFDETGYPIVVFEHHATAYTRNARTTIELRREDIGRECLIQLCGGPDAPVISGLIQPPLQASTENSTAPASPTRSASTGVINAITTMPPGN